MTEATKDGADRCSEFIDDIRLLFEKHDVQVDGSGYHLGGCELISGGEQDGWRLDMRDIQMLTEKKQEA